MGCESMRVSEALGGRSAEWAPACIKYLKHKGVSGIVIDLAARNLPVRGAAT